MMKSKGLLLAALFLAALAVGCPSKEVAPTVPVRVLFAWNAGIPQPWFKDKVVAWDDIQSFTVTVTEISMTPKSAEGEGEGEGARWILFGGAQDVDLRRLDSVSEFMSERSVPALKYAKVGLRLANPRLVLKDAPDTVITEVRPTTRARLYADVSIDLTNKKKPILMAVDFSDFLVVQTASTAYDWTPALRADISADNVKVEATGYAESVEAASALIMLNSNGAKMQVNCTNAQVHASDGSEEETGTMNDLRLGMQITVTGKLYTNAYLDAEDILISPAAPSASSTPSTLPIPSIIPSDT